MRKICFLFVLCLMCSKVQAMEVIDSANLIQNMRTALESMQQTQQMLQTYQTQLQQYQNMLTNTLNPSAWGFGELQNTLQGFVNLKDSLQTQFKQLQNLQNQFNLDTLMSGNSASSSEDFKKIVNAISGSKNMSEALEKYGQENAGSYNKAEMAAIGRGLEDTAIKNTVKLVEKQQEQLEGYSQRLQTLTSRAKGAQGQQEAIQIQTQIQTMMIEMQTQTLALMQAAEVRAATEEKKKVEEEKRQKKLRSDFLSAPNLPDPLAPGKAFKFPGQQ